MLTLDLSGIPPHLHVGTSSFSAADWCGPFYPESTPPAEYLIHYARQLRTVEIDATWHVMPNVRMTRAWADKVPDGFVFSVKVPKVITHESYLVDCEEEWRAFLRALEPLGDRLGPILFQFQYFAKGKDAIEYRTGDDFRRRLAAFLHLLPEGQRFVVEVRNSTWLTPALYDLLRGRNVALALVAFYTMPSGPALLERSDPVTADFSYLRFLGNHKAMDEKVAHARERGERQGDWSELIEDRSEETRAWVPAIRNLLGRQRDVYVYFNNHYAGFAPGSIDVFLKAWSELESRGA